ncbi:MAG: ATPase [Anaerolineae bacterium]|nr:ATPase [Anaerolineae bacterium]MDW8172450.1 ATPase [Anaerolineae bacterium]
MDIQHLVDRLEDLIDAGRHIFGTKYTIVDEERALELIDQMRISIPEEIEKAARVIAQRDRILAEAHEEAARIIQQQRERASALIDEHAVVQAAQARADAVREQARQEAARIMSEADQYVLQMLTKLEQQLVRDLSEVRNGISYVQSQPSSPPAPSMNASQPVYLPRQHDREFVDVDYQDDERA